MSRSTSFLNYNFKHKNGNVVNPKKEMVFFCWGGEEQKRDEFIGSNRKGENIKVEPLSLEK